MFDSIHSMVNYKGFWLTHAPIHPCELRGKRNIHGHVHDNSVKRGMGLDERYINACLEVNNFKPVKFQDILKEVRNEI